MAGQRTIFLDDVESAAREAATVVKAGGVVLYPTDTLYGLGADALSDKAVEKIYTIKGRDEKKPIHCIVADLEMAERYARVDNIARELAKAFWPGPLTLILKKRPEFDEGIARGIDTIGIRIPQHPFCLALAREFGGPITTTSANRSGKKPEQSVEEILTQLGDGSSGIDLAIDAGAPPAGGPPREPSTVVDLSGKEPVILREGAIPVADIWDTIRLEF